MFFSEQFRTFATVLYYWHVANCVRPAWSTTAAAAELCAKDNQNGGREKGEEATLPCKAGIERQDRRKLNKCKANPLLYNYRYNLKQK